MALGTESTWTGQGCGCIDDALEAGGTRVLPPAGTTTVRWPVGSTAQNQQPVHS
ncbi:hypothetical protein ABZ752_00270 [Streptomyces roseifaciens]